MRAHRLRRALAIAALTAAGLAPAVAHPAPAVAVASDDSLLISQDGQRFAPGSDIPLLTDAGRIVPGDVATDRVWLRNGADEAGSLRLDLVDVHADDAALASATELVFSDGAGRELGRVRMDDALAAGTCVTVHGDIPLAPGDDLRLDVALTVDPALGSLPGGSGRDGALGSMGFPLRATLADARAGHDLTECTTQSGAGSDHDLPATGGGVHAALLLLSTVFLGGGISSVWMGRRRREVADDRRA